MERKGKNHVLALGISSVECTYLDANAKAMGIKSFWFMSGIAVKGQKARVKELRWLIEAIC